MATAKQILDMIKSSSFSNLGVDKDSIVVDQDKNNSSVFTIRYNFQPSPSLSLMTTVYVKYYKYIIQVRRTQEEMVAGRISDRVYWRHKRCNKDFYKEVPYGIKRALTLFYQNQNGEYAGLTAEEFLKKMVPRTRGTKYDEQ